MPCVYTRTADGEGDAELGDPGAVLTRGTLAPADSPAAPATSPGDSVVSNLGDSSELSCPRGGAWTEGGFKARLIRMQRTPPRVP